MSIRRTPRSRTSVVSLIVAVTVALSGGGLLTAYAAEGGSGPVTSTSMHNGHADPAVDVSAQTALHRAMRTLWIQHMEWTYATVVAFADESPALQPTIERLLRNQVDIGDAVAPFYGERAAAQLTELLTTHIEQAVPVLTAAKAGDDDALRKAVKAWYRNADDIADFLAKANPAWPKRDMRDMMEAHITTTIGYAGDVLSHDHAGAIAKYDEAEAHMVEMADMLSQGLIAQFPDRF
ncbi:hypothetical protein [Agromyces sp. Marseille-P2726]|uniref:hypothetical protein n=1 Tax=Agromyces sp. Marseille-P2726 TaxID=2709132 RepID=UPI00156E998B|nr:hypothetical protein [Agromyces sp. Marseille-P2726]